MKIDIDFNAPSKTNLEYLKRKGLKLSFDYDEIQKQVHQRAFTVAKVTRLDLLNDIHEELAQAQAAGIGFEQFKRNLKPKLMLKGWWGGSVKVENPKTGEVKEIKVGARRLQTIFRTNANVAYSEQRYADQMKLPLSVYWRYSSILDKNARKDHIKIHGVIKHRDDPFWDVNYPPNGWNCRCKVNAYSPKDLEKRGWKVNSKDYGTIAHKDWAYNPAKVNSLSRINPPDFDKSLRNLPKLIKNPELDNFTDTQIKERFYNTLGVKAGDTYIDKIGDPMIVDDNLFAKANTKSKLRKQERHLYIDALAQSISKPDQIWLDYDTGGKRLVKKMLKFYQNNDGNKEATMAIFGYEKDKTQAVTLYHVREDEVRKRQSGKLIYENAKRKK